MTTTSRSILPLAITAGLALLLGTAAVRAASNRPGLRIDASSRARVVVRGHDTVFRIDVRREHGLHGPVTLGIWGLPAGSRRTWTLPNGRALRRKRRGRLSVVLPARHNRVLLVVHTYRRTQLGRVAARLRAKSARVRVRRRLSLRVVSRPAAAGDRPFGMRGTVLGALRPGTSQPIGMRIDNPYDFDLAVNDIDVTVDETTSRAGCSGSANYSVRQFAGAYPLVVPPGEMALADLVPDRRLWPRLAMLDLPRSQDACRGARLTLRFEGAATR